MRADGGGSATTALLAVAWLIREGDADAARSVLDAIGPFLDRLRFYPVPGPTPLTGGAVVFLQDVGTTAALLAAPARLAAPGTREAISVRVPLFDRLVALFLETVEREVPSLRRGDRGTPDKTADGRFVVDGGWPCQHDPDGWREPTGDGTRLEAGRGESPCRFNSCPFR